MRKYLIIGTGGVGGSIAGFLALGGKDVTCIARGEHLETIRREGLYLRSGLKGDRVIPVKACTADEYREVPDVVFVCVKGYSMDSIRDLLKRVATPRTVVIPILNVYGTGARIASLAPKGSCVLDGCIYIVGSASRSTCPTTSTATRSSSGPSSPPWLARAPASACPWVRCSIRESRAWSSPN